MITKSKSKVYRAVRLAPVVASLAALAMVAACARTNGNKTQISPQTQEKIANKVVSAVDDYNAMLPDNMAFAKIFQGATIKINERNDQGVSADIQLLLADRQPITLHGAIIGKESSGKFMDLKQMEVPSQDSISATATCGDAECRTVVAKISLLHPETPAPADVVAEDAKAKLAQGATAAAAAVDAATPPAATNVPVPAATGSDTSVPEVKDPAAVPAPAPVVAPAAVPVKMVVVGMNVLVFEAIDKAPANETAAQKIERLSVLKLVRSGTVEAGQASGPTKSYLEALADRTDLKDVYDAEKKASDEAAAAKKKADEAAIKAATDKSGDDESGSGTGAAAPAAAATGATGATGASGATGSTGATGTAGATGAAGSTGATDGAAAAPAPASAKPAVTK